MPTWKPGQSGNPRGRPPKGQSIAEALRQALREKDQTGRTNGERIAASLVRLADQGNLAAIAFIFERTEGKVTDVAETTITGKHVIEVVYADQP